MKEIKTNEIGTISKFEMKTYSECVKVDILRMNNRDLPEIDFSQFYYWIIRNPILIAHRSD